MRGLSLGLGLSRSMTAAGGAGEPTYGAEATALFARFSSDPGTTRKDACAALIDALLSGAVSGSNIWAKLDRLYITAAHDSQAACLDWKGGDNLTPTSSPTFTADRGFTGNGTSTYLASGYNPTTDAVGYALNSCHLGIWSRTNVQNGGAAIGSTSNGMAFITPRNAGNTMPYRLNQASNTGPANTDGSGHLLITRRGANSLEAYRNAVSLGTNGTTSTSIPNADFDILRAGTSYWPGEASAAHWGPQLSADEITDVFNAFAAYMTAVGA